VLVFRICVFQRGAILGLYSEKPLGNTDVQLPAKAFLRKAREAFVLKYGVLSIFG